MSRCHAAVIGAGPFGLAVAAELRRRQVDHVLIGRPLAFWHDHVPEALNLLSDPLACSLSADQFRIEHWEKQRGKASARPFPGREFVEYCTWFAKHACIEPRVDQVQQVQRSGSGFSLRLQSGDELTASNVVVAVGLRDFAFVPEVFRSLDRQMCSHTGVLKDLDQFRGKSLGVIGGGQSALEYAAMLAQAGADVEVLAREPQPRWYPYGGHIRPTTGDNGAVRKAHPGVRALVNHPEIFPRLPARLRAWWLQRSLRPAVDDHLRGRLQSVKLTFGRTVRRAVCERSGVNLELDDQSQRQVDHVILATGFCIEPSRIAMLDPALLREIRAFKGYPRLKRTMQSTARGLYFAGAAAAMTFGTDMWFVHGTPLAADRISRSIADGAGPR